jgi:hypothetical protein
VRSARRAARADVRSGAAADDLGGVGVQVLAALVVDGVVVDAQEGCDDGTHRLRMVAEGLPGEHRGQLHHARPVLR